MTSPSDKVKLSVIICTYNPNVNRLNQTLEGLKRQTLSSQLWELLIVDNNSSNLPINDLDIKWHPNIVILKEKKQGLTFARIKGFLHSSAPIVILVDDDNLLSPEYLEEILHILNEDLSLGAVGGKSIPLFEAPPPIWLNEFYGSLALRDLGDNVLVSGWQKKYPLEAPIGAGMAIKKASLNTYIQKITTHQKVINDRTGTSLSSGGDNDMILEILKEGWKVGYFPSLTLQHIIPESRMNVNYLSRLVNDISKSWVQLLHSHDINPWDLIPAWTVPLRKIRAYFAYRAWKSDVEYIKWKSICGAFEGRDKSLYK